MDRIKYIDSVKGFAIFCVLWGHSIQYLRNGYDFFHNLIFEFIYSFHIPLFFIVSGFFFSSSLKLSWVSFLQKKSTQLLLPCFVWSIVFMAFKLLNNIYYNDCIDWRVIYTIIIPFKWPFWFLKELFISNFLIYVLLKILKKEWLAFIISLCFVMVSPYCELQRFLLPIFWAGIYMKSKYQFMSKHIKDILLIFGTIFFISLFFWKGEYTIYMTSFPELFNLKTFTFNFSNIDISIFRLFIGLFGGVFWITLFYLIYEKGHFFCYIEKVGTATLGIYILQTIILEKLLNNVINFPTINIWIYNLIITPAISLLVLMACFYIYKLTSKNTWMGLLLYGNSFTKF